MHPGEKLLIDIVGERGDPEAVAEIANNDFASGD
jgi:hypothetical protein